MQNNYIIKFLQIASIMLMALTTIDTILKAMLVFGYVMLFRQPRWHKHLLIMFVMILILFIASGSMNSLTNK